MEDNFCSQDEVDSDQQLVDYTWLLTVAKLIVSHRTAFYLALEVPSDYQNMCELARDTHLANHLMTSRFGKAKTMHRSLPKSGDVRVQRMRKLWNLRGKLEELARLVAGRDQLAIANLLKKIQRRIPDFPPPDCKYHLDETIGLIEEANRINKNEGIASWKLDMRNDLQKRSRWLFRSKTTHFPALLLDGNPTATKDEAQQALLEHWVELQSKVSWTNEERQTKSDIIGQFLKSATEDLSIPSGRPDVRCFRRSLLGMNGAPGLDQWTACEAKHIAHCPVLLETIDGHLGGGRSFSFLAA